MFKVNVKITVLCLCFPCSVSFKKYAYVVSFARFLAFFDEKLRIDLKITKFYFLKKYEG